MRHFDFEFRAANFEMENMGSLKGQPRRLFWWE